MDRQCVGGKGYKMRRQKTRAELIQSIANMERHAALPMKAISVFSEHRIRNRSGFVSVEQFVDRLIVPGEIGILNDVRYRVKSRRGDK